MSINIEDLKKIVEDFERNKPKEELKPFEITKQDIKNFPKPPKPKPINKEEELKKQFSKIPEQTGYSKPNIFLKYYLAPLLIIFFNICGVVALLIMKSSLGNWFIIILIFYCGIALPLFLGIISYFFIRLIAFDRNKVTGKIISSVSKNFIVAYFYLTQKRIKRRVCLIDDDGISFHIKDARYIIDREKCFQDEENYICGFWLPDLPNQLGFDFVKYIDVYLNAVKDKDLTTSRDRENNIIDVTYSSKNLEKFRKDKIFYEFHEQMTPEAMKIVYILLGVIALCVIAFIIMFVTKN
jgi:hypothetical protein